MNNYFKKNTQSISKLWAINTITNNIGKIVETKDKIYCIVNKNKIKSTSFITDIYCEGYNPRNKEIREKYNINKPICYVFRNINFNKEVRIFGYDSVDIYIENCKFKYNNYISTKGDCALVNSVMEPTLSNTILSNNLVVGNSNINAFNKIILGAIDNLVINNSKITGYDMLSYNPCVCISSNKKTISIDNSNISSKNINISAPNILFSKSSLVKGKNSISITSDNIDRILCDTKSLIFNGKTIASGKITLNKEELELLQKRQELLSNLTNINDDVKEKISNKGNKTLLKNLK